MVAGQPYSHVVTYLILLSTAQIVDTKEQESFRRKQQQTGYFGEGISAIFGLHAIILKELIF